MSSRFWRCFQVFVHRLDFRGEIMHSYISRLLQGVPDEKKEEITLLMKILFLKE